MSIFVQPYANNVLQEMRGVGFQIGARVRVCGAGTLQDYNGCSNIVVSLLVVAEGCSAEAL